MYVPWLADAARSTGYRVVEIPGWQSRGHGGMRAVEGVVGHHTATSQAAPGDYPSLGIVTNGRSDLAGPLANLGLGRDGTIYVIAAGLCYHAGASRWAGFTDLNDEFLGIEAESAGTGVWTDAQRDCYPKLVGALLRYMNRGIDRYAGHKDVCVPIGRKIDPVGIDTAWLRSRAAAITPGDDDMTPDQSRKLDEIVQQLTGSREADKYPGWESKKFPGNYATLVDFIRAIDANLINLSTTVAKLADTVSKLTPVPPAK
jgi:hypothetical protein